jgi:hypothetical protein
MASTQDRYDTTLDTRVTRDGKLVYRSLRPRNIPIDPINDIQLAATDATRMDKLAFKAYGEALDWWRIASANGRVDGSLYFRPGTKIILPSGK